jgi:demethylmenaquinone methyltransferase/2-methoxy-6-polyprenyl-1,4-benzoquinol methylase
MSGGRIKLKTEDLGNSKILNLITRPAGMMMASRARKWIFNPVKILSGADVQSGETVLEVGCGTGFFTLPAAEMIGEEGQLVAMDASSGFMEVVSRKVKDAGLKNVRTVKRDALDTGLESASMDKALLFGVIPFPTLPLEKLLPEMHRVLRPEGKMAVWLFPPMFRLWIPKAIVRSGLFTFLDKKNGVHNFRRH